MSFLCPSSGGAREVIVIPDDDEQEWNGFSDEEMRDTGAGNQADTNQIDGQEADKQGLLREKSFDVDETLLDDRSPEDSGARMSRHTTEEDIKAELTPQPGTRRKTRNSMSPEDRAQEIAHRTAATIEQDKVQARKDTRAITDTLKAAWGRDQRAYVTEAIDNGGIRRMMLNTGMCRAEAKDAVLEQVLQERAFHGVSGPYIADVIYRLFRNDE